MSTDGVPAEPGRLLRARIALVQMVRGIVGGPGIDWTTDRALQRLAGREHIETIIDVGASTGIWTNRALRHFPGARALLIEAQGQAHGRALEALKQRDPRVDYVIAAAGDQVGEVHFDAGEPFSGAASYEPFARDDIVVPMTTIDAEVARRSLGRPFLVKLDTHGFEAQILEGARETLSQAAAVIIEAYNFELRPGVMRFHQLCAFMEERGFRCADLADPMRRPKDAVLWQMDLVFERADRPWFGDRTYR